MLRIRNLAKAALREFRGKNTFRSGLKYVMIKFTNANTYEQSQKVSKLYKWKMDGFR